MVFLGGGKSAGLLLLRSHYLLNLATFLFLYQFSTWISVPLCHVFLCWRIWSERLFVLLILVELLISELLTTTGLNYLFAMTRSIICKQVTDWH